MFASVWETIKHTAAQLQKLFAECPPVCLIQIHSFHGYRRRDFEGYLVAEMPPSELRESIVPERDFLEFRFFLGIRKEIEAHDANDFLATISDWQTAGESFVLIHPYLSPDATESDEAFWARQHMGELKLILGKANHPQVALQTGTMDEHIVTQLKQLAHECALKLKDTPFCLKDFQRWTKRRGAKKRQDAQQTADSLKRANTPDETLLKIKRAQEYMRDGDCYLLNYSERRHHAVSPLHFTLTNFLDSWLRSPSRFGFFMRTPSRGVLSFSPERFVTVQNDWILTEPIKGTLASTDEPSLEQAQELWTSEKETLEQHMVVDLLRNDLNLVCHAGSVEVWNPFFARIAGRLLQMESFVWGKLKTRQVAKILQAMLPAGSVTGTPKKRVCEIIEQLESYPRGFYTGICGAFDAPDKFESILLIRSHFLSHEQTYTSAGAGITILSEPQAEAIEIQQKLDTFCKDIFF